MSLFERATVLGVIKALLKKTIYRPGAVVRILGGPLRGYRFVVGEDTGWALLYGGWEPVAQRVYARFVRGGDVVYDIGANVGIHSLLFAKLVGPGGAVYAFEPLASNRQVLERVLALNGVTTVAIVESAVGATAGEATFRIGKHPSQGSLVGIGREDGRAERVSVTTLDDAVSGGMAPPDFIKLDVEGAESQALAGATRVISAHQPTLAIDLHTPEEDVKVGALLKHHGYRAYRMNDEVARRVQRSPKLLLPIERLDHGWPASNGVWGTILAVHPRRHSSVLEDL